LTRIGFVVTHRSVPSTSLDGRGALSGVVLIDTSNRSDLSPARADIEIALHVLGYTGEISFGWYLICSTF